jgi:hypothetical protein
MVIIIIENASELLLPKVNVFKSCGELVDDLKSKNLQYNMLVSGSLGQLFH